MKRYPLSVLLLYSFASFLLFPCFAEAAKYGKVTVDAVPLYETHEETCRGYTGYLFQVKNNDTEPHIIQIKIPNEIYTHGANLVEADSRTLKLAAGQNAHLWIYQPSIEMSNSDALVTIDGYSYEDRLIPMNIEHGELDNSMGYHPVAAPEEEQNKEISIADIAEEEKETAKTTEAEGSAVMEELGMGMSPGFSLDMKIAVLVSRGFSGNLRDQVVKLLQNCNMIRSVQKTSEWPTNWIAYSQFDGIIITDTEFDTLPPEAVTALADYASVGGVVWVRPDNAAETKLTPQLKELQHAATVGIGTLLTGKRDGRQFKEQTIKQIRCVNAWHEPSEAEKILPAVQRNATPVRLFLVLLIFYALLIGPALQVVLKLKRRRIWMLWIIPAASLVVCVVVFIGSYLAEGFSGFANFRNITILDQKAGRASTVGWTSFYSPLADSDGLKFSTATVLQPQWKNQYWGFNLDKHHVSIDWTSGQHFTFGWLMAKTPLSFRLWKAEPRREKLTIRKDEQGNFTVTNALGADADGLRLCMPDGTNYTAEKIFAGKTVTLTKDFALPNTSLSGVKEYCLRTSNWSLDDHEDASKPRVHLEPGTYQVMLDGHPFVNTAITDPAQDQGKTLVFGSFEVE